MGDPAQLQTTLRQILVPLDSKIAAKSTIETAFMIAKTLSSHVKIVMIGEDPKRDENKYPPNVVDMTPPKGSVRIRHDDEIAHRRWQEIQAIVEAACARHHCGEASGRPQPDEVSATILMETGDPAAIIGRHGLFSDLIVFPKPTSTIRMRSSVRCADALLGAGRPIVVTPSTSMAGFGRRVAIAWDETKEFSRAVAAAVPFLRRASSVVVLMPDTARHRVGLTDGLSEYLRTHGIRVEAWEYVETEGRPLGGRRLLDETARIKADLLVMGAGRLRRFRDRAIGPDARELLGGTQIPVLMAGR